MWNNGGIIKEKWTVLVRANKLQSLFVDAIRCIILPFKLVITARVTAILIVTKIGVPTDGRTIVELHTLSVAPQVRRVVRVSVPLTVIAKKPIEALEHWIPF